MASKFAQDMPPPGGYGPVDWAKKIPKRGIGGYASFAIVAAVMGAAWTGYYYEQQRKRRWRVEMNDARIALEPLILAEQQRMFLTQLRKNRDDEKELMKNNPDWEVGKWEGKPIYHNVAGRFPPFDGEEYYAHAKGMALQHRLTERLRH